MEDTAGDNTFLKQAKAMMAERFQVWVFPATKGISLNFLSSTLGYVWSGRILTRLIRKKNTLSGSAENRKSYVVTDGHRNPRLRFLA